MTRIFFVDITAAHGAANQDLSATVNELVRRDVHCHLMLLKGALFRDYVDPASVDLVECMDADWQDVWVKGEGINRNFPVRALNRLYRRYRFYTYRTRVAEEIQELVGSRLPEAVHLNSFNLRLAPVFAACKRLHVPVVAHVRSYMRLDRPERRLAAGCRHVLAASEALRRDVLGRSRLAPERVSVWSNGLPFREIAGRVDRERTRQEYRIGADQTVVSIVGRIAPYRGHETFLDGIIPLMKEMPNLVGMVVGRFGYRERGFAEALQKKAEIELGGDRFRFVFDRKDIESFMVCSDIVVHPNVYNLPSEGVVEVISRELLLTMGLGIPVIATRAGGAEALISDGETGLLVPPEGPEEITAAVRRMLADPEGARAMADRACRTVQDRHSSERRTAEFLEIYRTKVLN